MSFNITHHCHLDLSIAILAGGQSARMGRDKARMSLDGKQTLLERLDERLAPLSADRFVVSRDGTDYDDLGIRSVPDVLGDSGVLGGIGSAIAQCRMDRVLVVSCDMPFVHPEVIRFLAELDSGEDAIVPVTHQPSRQATDRTCQVLHGIYRRRCLPAIASCISEGDLRAVSFLDRCRSRFVEESVVRTIDPHLLTFMSVNTPTDFQRAKVIADRSAD